MIILNQTGREYEAVPAAVILLLHLIEGKTGSEVVELGDKAKLCLSLGHRNNRWIGCVRVGLFRNLIAVFSIWPNVRNNKTRFRIGKHAN